MNHREIIELWPTVSDLARDLGVNNDRVYKWHRRRKIPSEFWLDILEQARKRKIEGLDVEDFAIGARNLARKAA